MTSFAADLRAWLDRHGLSAYAAAPMLGTTQATVGKWLRGKGPANPTAVRALMDARDRETTHAGR